MQTVVSNTSPLIILAKTSSLYLLKNVFDKIIIPKTVYDEIVEKNDTASFEIKQADFIVVVETEKNETLEYLYLILDKGEAEAITLAKQLNTVLIIDEKKGRKLARNFGLNVIGFLGILLINYRKNFISESKVLHILEQTEEFGYRLSENLKEEFLSNL